MATPLGKIYFLPLRLDLRSDRFPCFFHSLTIRSVRSLICDRDHRVLRPDLSLIIVDLSQEFNCFDENSFANFARVSTRLASSQIALSTRSAVGLCALTTRSALYQPAWRRNASCQFSGRVINAVCRRISRADNAVCTLLARVDLVPNCFLEFFSSRQSDLVMQAPIQFASSVYLLYCSVGHWRIAFGVFSHFILKKQTKKQKVCFIS